MYILIIKVSIPITSYNLFSQIFVDFLNSIPSKLFISDKLECMRSLIGNIIFQNAGQFILNNRYCYLSPF